MSEALRSRRSDVRYEPRFEQSPAGAPPEADPLAELARLVGHEDPFRSVFGNGTKPQPARAPAADAPAGQPLHEDQVSADYEAGAQAPTLFVDDAFAKHESDMRLRPSVHEPTYDDGAYEAEEAHGHAYPDQHPDDSGHAHDVEDPHAGYYADAGPASYDLHETSADAWAAGEVSPEQYPAPFPATEDAVTARAPRRPLVVLAAVLVLTGGGLAATFLSRASHDVAAVRAAPTILAANGPNKIKSADPAATTPEDSDAALLSRNGAAASGGPAKVVNSQEQPIDLTQLPKTKAKPGSGVAVESNEGSPFPEPRKVKTFIVHPDSNTSFDSNRAASGSPAPAASAAVASFPAGLAPTDVPPSATPSARASTPKAAARATTTPKAATEPTIADLAQAATAVPARARQQSSPGPTAHAAPKSKPIEVAEADPGTTAATSGAFGLQLAAAPSEQDARDAFARLQHKFGQELGSFKPSIHKVETGDKTVYRLRVGSLSQDEAKTLCSKLQASGGTCYVVHN